METVSAAMKVQTQTRLTRNEKLELKRREAQSKRDEEKKQVEADQRLTTAELQTRIDQLTDQIRVLEVKRPKKRVVTQQQIRDLHNDDEGPSVRLTHTRVLSPKEEASCKEINTQIHALELRISYFKDLQDPSRVEARKKKAAQVKTSLPRGFGGPDASFMRRMARR